MLQFLDSEPAAAQPESQPHAPSAGRSSLPALVGRSVGCQACARDQLRNPVELLTHILVTMRTETFELTGTLAAGQPTSLEPDPATAPRTSWLTREYLQDLQASTLERTKELEQVARCRSAQGGNVRTASPTALASPDAQDSADQDSVTTQDPRTKQLLENIPRALPSIQAAVTGLRGIVQAAGNRVPSSTRRSSSRRPSPPSWRPPSGSSTSGA